jgi:transposase
MEKLQHKTIEKNNHENFLKFLKKLYRKYPKKHLHIIADNLTVHKHKKINDWISTKKRITMHFTPTYSSWLNQVEIWFNILTKDVLKGGVWRSKNNSWIKLSNILTPTTKQGQNLLNGHTMVAQISLPFNNSLH